MKMVIKVVVVVQMILDGVVFLIGGFMGVGMLNCLIDVLVVCGVCGLMVVVNDIVLFGCGIGKLISSGVVLWVIVLYIGLNFEMQVKMILGEIEVELVL